MTLATCDRDGCGAELDGPTYGANGSLYCSYACIPDESMFVKL